MHQRRTRLIVVTSTLLWLIAVGAGLGMIWKFENSPEVAGAPPSRWPAESQIERASDRSTIVMLAHPHCPCTRASIGELALLMARSQGLVSVQVLFFKPAGFPDGWEKTDLWYSAASIPGVTVVCDESGIEARCFNQKSSGAVVLYDAEGRLLFNGGITGARGHSGDNDGRAAIVSLLVGEAGKRAQTPVFGCSLIEEDNSCTEGENLCRRPGTAWTEANR